MSTESTQNAQLLSLRTSPSNSYHHHHLTTHSPHNPLSSNQLLSNHSLTHPPPTSPHSPYSSHHSPLKASSDEITIIRQYIQTVYSDSLIRQYNQTEKSDREIRQRNQRVIGNVAAVGGQNAKSLGDSIHSHSIKSPTSSKSVSTFPAIFCCVSWSATTNSAPTGPTGAKPALSGSSNNLMVA